MFKHPHCGGSHATVTEARQCQAQPAGTRSLVGASATYSGAVARLAAQTPHPMFDRTPAAPPAWSTNGATERQVSYLKDLIAKRCAERAPIDVVETAMHVTEGKPISFDEASRAIAAIKLQPYRETTTQPEVTTPTPAQANRPNVKALKAQVPDGRYAVRGTVAEDTDEKLRFFFVRTSKRGYVRIDQIVSDDRLSVSFGRYAKVLQTIIDVTPAVAAKAYGDNMGQCSACGRVLTDEDNPYKPFGFGPDCGPKRMGGI